MSDELSPEGHATEIATAVWLYLRGVYGDDMADFYEDDNRRIGVAFPDGAFVDVRVAALDGTKPKEEQ